MGKYSQGISTEDAPNQNGIQLMLRCGGVGGDLSGKAPVESIGDAGTRYLGIQTTNAGKDRRLGRGDS